MEKEIGSETEMRMEDGTGGWRKGRKEEKKGN